MKRMGWISLLLIVLFLPACTSTTSKTTSGLSERQGGGEKTPGKLIYESNQDSFASCVTYSTVGGFQDRIIITQRQSNEAATLELKAFSTEAVGINKSLRNLHGKVEFEYKVVDSEAVNGSNIVFYMIPMEETGPSRTGYVEARPDVQDEPAIYPYRAKFSVPLEHFGDNQWHHGNIDFNFRHIQNAFYSIFGPRINERSMSPAAAHVQVRNVKVFSYE